MPTESEPTQPMIPAPRFQEPTDQTVIVDATKSSDPSLSVAPRNRSAVVPGRPPVDDKTDITPMEVLQNAGNRLAGRYELLNIIGEGGMGTVYHARDLELKEEIAIKLLQSHFVKNDQDVERFKREIITARRITHPNVIRIHDFGFTKRDAFISMELLKGGSLAELLESERQVSYDDALEIAIGIADGLGEAHRKGIIHRDIKPHNVMFDEFGVVKLLDFGIARLASAKTTTVGFTGTPYYMAPEQADAQNVTTRSDVYSLGVLIYELVTGELPFVSESIIKLALMHAHDTPRRPRLIKPDIPAGLESLILKCMEKRPENRFANAGEVAAALRQFHREYSGSMEIELPAAAVTHRKRAPLRTRRGLGLALLIGGGLVAGLGGTAFVIANGWQRARPTPVAASPTRAIQTPSPAPIPGYAALSVSVVGDNGARPAFEASITGSGLTASCSAPAGSSCMPQGVGFKKGKYKVTIKSPGFTGEKTVKVDPARDATPTAVVRLSTLPDPTPARTRRATPRPTKKVAVATPSRAPPTPTPTPRPTAVVARTGTLKIIVFGNGILYVGKQRRETGGGPMSFTVPADKTIKIRLQSSTGKGRSIRNRQTAGAWKRTLFTKVGPGEQKEIKIQVKP